MQFKKLTREEAIAAGYGVYNGYDHLAVDLDKSATITVKTANGSQVTFNFVIGEEYDICVDVKAHHTPVLPEIPQRNKGTKRQEWRMFNGGTKVFCTDGIGDGACTLGSLVLTPKSYL